ncbi:unnamed protein product [Nezara viridula]|uniref:SURP motif domain-containing protein n=1 Tax=Nezara viridula TaxID=85310 RepID=A0A9P0HL40_NEZVI|nr:unnamed protein product [Nezara viridula]
MAKKGDENEEKTELLVFGYACKLFRDDERALLIDNETHLIPWMGDESLKIDRYDGRGALYDLASHESQPGSWDQLSPEELEIEERCDSERYRSLFMNEVEEITYKEEQVKRQQQDYGQIAYDYDAQMSVDSADQPELPSKPFVPPPDMVLPPDLKVPETMKHSAIIERTALFIAQQGSQMEILMKLKQQGNKNFDFLSHNDPLHEFYKHVLSLIKSGSYVPTSQEHIFDENPVDVSTEDDSDGHYLHPSLVTTLNPKNAPPPPTTVPSADKSSQPSNEPPLLVQKVVEKMINYVIRNGPAFERAIMRKDDERFNFIRTTHKYYAFYRSSLMKKQKIYNEELLQKLQKQKAAEEKIQQSTEDHETKTFKKRPLPVNFSIKKPKESKGLEVPSALPVEESSDEDEDVSSPKQSSSQGSNKTESHSGETSDDPEYINPLTKRLKKSNETTKKHKQKKDAILQSERKLKVAQFIKDLKKKSS